MKIAVFASESNPFCKTGGLADVAFSLSKELAAAGHKVVFGLPYYKNLRLGDKKPKEIGSFNVYLSWRVQEARIYSLNEEGITYYLIGNDYYFGRDSLYGYDDDGERFAFFALAAKSLLRFLSFDADVVHVHDWQAAMLPCLIKEGKPFDPFFRKMKFVLTIHNPAFKGLLDRYYLGDFYNLDDHLFTSGQVRFDGMVSTLKSGIVYSEKITTVSPSHRDELLRNEGGHNLDGVLRLREDDFLGILNGIDYTEWNPLADAFIAVKYDASSRASLHEQNRADLLSSFHIVDQKGPVYGLVSRLSWQKGIDLVIDNFENLLSKNVNLVVLGSGEYGLERRFEDLRARYPEKCGIYIGYNEKLAHKIYAGIDFFLMPSLFEPCGLSQMISQRYGALPIVRYTGGLRDTVKGYTGKANEKTDGIGFNDYNISGLSYALGVAEGLYQNREAMEKCVANAMMANHSWKRSAALYEKLFFSLLS